MRTRLTMLAVGLLALACGRGEGGGGLMNQAETKAIPAFHAQYDREDFDAIYNSAAKEFREAAKKQDYDTFMKAVRRKLGTVKSSTRQNWNVFVGTGGRRVTLTYATQFENGSGTEIFTFVSRDGAPTLLGYNVNSNTLIVK